MQIIKKIILWILYLFKKLFGKKEKKDDVIINNNNSIIKKSNKSKINDLYSNETLPPYMVINNQDKQLLIDYIQNIKRILNLDTMKKKEIAKIITLISNYDTNVSEVEEYLNNHDFDKINNKRMDILLTGCDNAVKENVYSIISDYKNYSKTINETVHNLDEINEHIRTQDISFAKSGVIKDKLNDISLDNESIDSKKVELDKNVLNIIKNWDKNIISEVKLEYQKINYVTISTVMIDNIVNKFQKIEDDYQHHRFNKTYYEKELGKIREQIDYLKKIKNSSVVYKEIEQLRKELYTKSKDKYDILYNNEIFININKKCDELLGKVNQKVIDIKKQETKEEKKEQKEDKDEKDKEENLKKILKRFQDLNLSRNLIMLHKEKENEILDYSELSSYLDKVYFEFINGIPDEFNYQRNRAKTELVKLYNDLNNIISHKKKKPQVSIDHINFKMEDLVDAVIVKKDEVEFEINGAKDLSSSELVDDRISHIKEKFIGNTYEKVLKKTN